MTTNDPIANPSETNPSYELTPIDFDPVPNMANAAAVITSASVAGSEGRLLSARNKSRHSSGKRQSRAAVAPIGGPEGCMCFVFHCQSD